MRARNHQAVTNTDQHACSSTVFAAFADEVIEQSLCARFAAQVVAHRSCLAVCDSNTSLTYGELDGWASGIASAVLDRTGDSSGPVPLMFAQGAASTAAILGVLKSGKAYVSLEPADPRSQQIVDSVNAVLVLTDTEHRDAARTVAGNRPLVIIDEVGSADDPDVKSAPDDLAYVFFTSGSTGRPKGVYDTHRNVLHNVLRYTNTLRIAPTDRLSLLQSPSFSGTVSSLFSALLNGAAVFPFRLDQEGVGRLAGWLRDERITIYHSVPAIFRALLHSDGRSFPDVRVVRLEGDRASSLDVELHRHHFVDSSVLVNGLGLTEAGLVRQLFVDRRMTTEQGVLPVGYPVRDMDVLIVDDDAEAVPAGSPGEIAVRSRYLALGYWNEPELTDERFFSEGEIRTYLTGDLGRLRDDGCLEYLGRRDGELKILGNRVEPAEIEAELVRISGVKEAAVTTQEGRRGEGLLVGFVVTDASRVPQASDVRRALLERLPSYMVPSTVSAIDELPLSPNGKIDRQALVELAERTAFRPPATESERLVARIWEDVLEVRPIGADDDFFALGGDSLAAAEVVAYLERKTGASPPASVLVGAPTVAGFAAALRRGHAYGASKLAVLRNGGDRAPLILLHGNTGNVLHFVDLLPRLDGGRPVWGLEYMATDDLSVSGIAACHVALLQRQHPSGPFLLVGFCFGAVIAHEIACQLRANGREVSLLALLGITPLEFPTLVASRRTNENSLVSRARYHIDNAWALPKQERPRYFARRGMDILMRSWQHVGRRTAGQPSVYEAIQRALAAHPPSKYPGRALVVLHAGDTGAYTLDSAHVWAALADQVDLEVLPGAGHAMLEEPGVWHLAGLIQDRLSSIP